MSITGFQGRYREERMPFYEKQSPKRKDINRFFKYMHSPDIQDKISQLPQKTLLNASVGQNKGQETVKLMYVPYGEGEHKRFEQLSGKRGLDSLTLTTKSIDVAELQKSSLPKKVKSFLDNILSVYDGNKK